MNLKDLEFKIEDGEFELRHHWQASNRPNGLAIVESINEPVTMISIDRANRILREKLEKAKVMLFPTPEEDWCEADGVNPNYPLFTKRGRLVCEEDLETD